MAPQLSLPHPFLPPPNTSRHGECCMESCLPQRARVVIIENEVTALRKSLKELHSKISGESRKLERMAWHKLFAKSLVEQERPGELQDLRISGSIRFMFSAERGYKKVFLGYRADGSGFKALDEERGLELDLGIPRVVYQQDGDGNI
ncbi:hypothetical protein M501DRAFT_1020987 [Patellaria atrata CBS 101060]|uniref:Uncharacterized protein n=1 Tax=Patellaria atrata CBS 101060 TaxID=1346257 RepID=A0A9P4S147_9PEZI|nr:hypothetical protein M501DRAFT_1020987 [Patellaria atrata CBS 101060]